MHTLSELGQVLIFVNFLKGEQMETEQQKSKHWEPIVCIAIGTALFIAGILWGMIGYKKAHGM